MPLRPGKPGAYGLWRYTNTKFAPQTPHPIPLNIRVKIAVETGKTVSRQATLLPPFLHSARRDWKLISRYFTTRAVVLCSLEASTIISLVLSVLHYPNTNGGNPNKPYLLVLIGIPNFIFVPLLFKDQKKKNLSYQVIK